MRSKQGGGIVPRIHPALNGATVVIGGTCGQAYSLRPAGRHLAASPCGMVAVWWPLWGPGAVAQPVVLIGGKAVVDYSIKLAGRTARRRFSCL